MASFVAACQRAFFSDSLFCVFGSFCRGSKRFLKKPLISAAGSFWMERFRREESAFVLYQSNCIAAIACGKILIFFH